MDNGAREHGWLAPRALLAAALWAVAASVAARELGMAAGAAAAATALVVTLVLRRPGPWLVVVPAALGAVDAPASAVPWPRPGPVGVEGTVVGRIDVDPRGATTRLRVEAASGHALFAVLHGSITVLPGDVVSGVARFAPQEHRRREGRLPVVTAAADGWTVVPGPPSPRRLTEACRLWMQRALLAAVSGGEGVLLCHLVLGHGPPMAGELVNAHRATGLTHLLAVSGAHASMLGLLCGIVYGWATGRRAAGSRRYRRFCVVFLALYGGVTGMEPPVFRAVVAFTLVLWARARGRRVTVTAALALPALLTALLAPDDLLSASFCLSYAAVAGLALAGVFRADAWHERYLRMPIVGSCWATLTTMPLTLFYFGQVAPWTILATPLLAPVVALMLACGLVAASITPLAGPLVGILAWPLFVLTRVYCEVVLAFSWLPFTPVFARCKPDPVLWVGCGVLGLAVVAFRPGRRSVAALCLGLSLPFFFAPADHAPGLSLLAVGHGQSCLARCPGGANVLVDCGRLGDGRGPARAVARALLPARSIDVLVLTHADFDHCGGVPPLLERVRVARAVLPAEMVDAAVGRALVAHGVVLDPVAPGAHRDVAPGVVVFRPVLEDTIDSDTSDSGISDSDTSDSDISDNDAGLWVEVDLGGVCALVAGDAEELGVRAWLDGPAARNAEVLVLPHHGLPHEEVVALLERVGPRLALVSNGAVTGGESAQGQVARRMGVRVLETGRVGTIHVRAGDPVEIATTWPLQLR